MSSELKEGMTGVLDVVLPDERVTLQWNGNPDDQAAARETFERVVDKGWVLASVIDAPGKATRVSTWGEVQEKERTTGTVAVVISPAIAGG